MSENETAEVKVTKLGSVSLTENQVKQAIVAFLYKSDEFKDLVNDRKVALITQWQTSKWSDPNSFVHLDIIDVPEDFLNETDLNSPQENNDAE